MQAATLTIGDRIYYTGDAANASEWTTVTFIAGTGVELLYDGGGTTYVPFSGIGDVYNGTMNPRFVTKAAYDAYTAKRIAQIEEAAAKFRARQIEHDYVDSDPTKFDADCVICGDAARAWQHGRCVVCCKPTTNIIEGRIATMRVCEECAEKSPFAELK